MANQHNDLRKLNIEKHQSERAFNIISLKSMVDMAATADPLNRKENY